MRFVIIVILHPMHYCLLCRQRSSSSTACQALWRKALKTGKVPSEKMASCYWWGECMERKGISFSVHSGLPSVIFSSLDFTCWGRELCFCWSILRNWIVWINFWLRYTGSLVGACVENGDQLPSPRAFSNLAKLPRILAPSLFAQYIFRLWVTLGSLLGITLD